MNSYNENLQNSVINSLQALELEKKNMWSKREAAIFTLFYAEGAQITATQKLEGINYAYHAKQDILNQAVANNDISSNMLASANEQKKYVGQAVTNSSVAAANVQVAANAVLRLASDMGSIFSIVSAANMDTEIYQQSKEAYDLMTDTAYEAELASQIGMETSSLVAAVSSGTVADLAKATSGAVTNLYTTMQSQFDSLVSIIITENGQLAAASAAEKVAEGVLEYINADFYATNDAYIITNKALNLNLYLPFEEQKSDEFVVSFTPYKSPFSYERSKVKDVVKEYNIMVVSNSYKTVFSITNAESILTYGNRHVAVKPSDEKDGKFTVKIDATRLKDVNGDDLDLGEEYTVFVLATLTDAYKKALNNFDDYMTAPSSPFTLVNKLVAPKADKDNVVVKDDKLTFHVSENQDFKVEYRCMFLPYDLNLSRKLLTETELWTIEKDVEKLSHRSKVLNGATWSVEAIEAKLRKLADEQGAVSAKIEDLRKDLKKATSDKQRKKLEDEIEVNNKKLSGIKSEIKELEDLKYNQLGFFFNKRIAEQITKSNYIVAKKSADGGEAKILSETTDVFGNRLVENHQYIPVVLVLPMQGEDKSKYRNDMSSYKKAVVFTYKSKEKKS